MLTKTPTETVEYQIDWSGWLGESATISASSWTVPAGITKDADSHNGTTTLVRLSGGTWGETYELTNLITAGSLSEERPLTVTIQRSVAYCSTAEVRRRASGGSGSGGSATTTALTNDELEALIEQASRMFDLVCGVSEGHFNPSPIPIATERTFYGNGLNYLKLDPYVEGSLSITFPEGYTTPTYIERDGHLILTTSTGIAPPFLYGEGWYQGVPITAEAIWGYTETPADVKMAVIELVLNLWRETDPATIKMIGLEGQPLRERMPPRVWEVARRYRAKGVAFV